MPYSSPGPIAGGDRYEVILALLVRPHVDLGGDRKVLELPRHPSAHRWRERRPLLDPRRKLVLDQADHLAVVMRLAGAEHENVSRA